MELSPHDPVRLPADPLQVLPEHPTRQDLADFADLLLSVEQRCGAPDVETVHHHGGGVYGRSVFLQPGTFLAGLPHKRAGLATCVGDITVWTEHGRQRLTGAHVLATLPGTMRIGYAHGPTFWMTTHVNPTGGTDVEAIEAALVEEPEKLLSRRQPVRGVLS